LLGDTIKDRFGSVASFSAGWLDVCLSPDSGGIADIPQPPLGADSVEKVESNATAKTSLKLTQSELRQEKPS